MVKLVALCLLEELRGAVKRTQEAGYRYSTLLISNQAGIIVWELSHFLASCANLIFPKCFRQFTKSYFLSRFGETIQKITFLINLVKQVEYLNCCHPTKYS